MTGEPRLSLERGRWSLSTTMCDIAEWMKVVAVTREELEAERAEVRARRAAYEAWARTPKGRATLALRRLRYGIRWLSSLRVCATIDGHR